MRGNIILAAGLLSLCGSLKAQITTSTTEISASSPLPSRHCRSALGRTAQISIAIFSVGLSEVAGCRGRARCGSVCRRAPERHAYLMKVSDFASTLQ
jgi:hypothetical protein